MIEKLRQWLREPDVRDIHVDDHALLDIHGDILREKRLLRSTFESRCCVNLLFMSRTCWRC